MFNTSMRRWQAAVVVLIVATGSGAAVLLSAQTPGADRPPLRTGRTSDEGVSFSADLTIRQTAVTRDGRPRPSTVPRKRFHLARTRGASGWRVTMTLTAADRPAVETREGPRALDHPFLITRWEFDESTRAARLFNARGEEVRLPGAVDRQLLKLPAGVKRESWSLPARSASVVPEDDASPAQGIVSLAAETAARRAKLERRYGRPGGRVRGLDRYIAASRDLTYEMLVNPESALPAELNLVRAGRLLARTTFRHEAQASGAFVRRAVRTEQESDDGTGERSIVDFDVTDVKIEMGGRP